MGIGSLVEQNPWWVAKEKILEDIHIARLSEVPLAWNPSLLESLDLSADRVYTVRGSRQIGKTTALKLLVKRLLPTTRRENICYFTCNTIDTYHDLLEVMVSYLDWVENDDRRYLLIDEITFVQNWTRALKHLADMGRLRSCTCVITGSNAHDLKYEVERMPGRRGRGADMDKIMFPLSFREYVELKSPDTLPAFSSMSRAKRNYEPQKKHLQKLFHNYCMTGGYMPAINDLEQSGSIGLDIYQMYLSWILGDLARMGRQETYSRQILSQAIVSLTSHLGFDTIAGKTSIESHRTVGDYVEVMESNFILRVLYQIGKRNVANTRKSKKIYFQDPFLYWVFTGYVNALSDYFRGAATRLADPVVASRVVENCVMNELMRYENTVTWSNRVFFYTAANSVEIDFLLRSENEELIPIEVKYRGSVTGAHFRYMERINARRGVIVSKQDLVLNGDRWIVPVEVFLLLPRLES